jgi:aspartokinase-like uncharacterized kinase
VIVVKVGGSLYGRADLGPALLACLCTLNEPVLIVPGGGAFAEAIRAFDRLHNLGEERSHWLALESMNTAGAFLRSLGIVAPMLDAVAFCREHDELPHSWIATSDSVAALAARVLRATRLVLLKSVDIPPGTSWNEAANQGWVDVCFPDLVRGLTCAVESRQL